MRLYNQKNVRLEWSMGGQSFAVDPFGQIDLADELVEFCKARGLPLDRVPVAPEAKAMDAVAASQAAERGDALRGARADAERAKASEASARDALEREQLEHKATRERCSGLDAKVAKLSESLRLVEADKRAGEDLLSDTAKKLAATEDKLAKLEAMAKVADKPAKKG